MPSSARSIGWRRSPRPERITQNRCSDFRRLGDGKTRTPGTGTRRRARASAKIIRITKWKWQPPSAAPACGLPMWCWVTPWDIRPVCEAALRISGVPAIRLSRTDVRPSPASVSGTGDLSRPYASRCGICPGRQSGRAGTGEVIVIDVREGATGGIGLSG